MNLKGLIRKLMRNNRIEGNCWVWTKSCNAKGYAHTSINGKLWRLNRLSYRLFMGAIPSGFLVCHTCDNRRCFNPQHLFLGTNGANMRDMVLKDRHADFSGDQNPAAKITEKEVYEIRLARELGAELKPLANKYGLSFSGISAICRRKTWKHVQ